MEDRKQIAITVGTFIPAPPTKLLVSALCAYYEISERELFCIEKGREESRRRSMLYFLAKKEIDMDAASISRAYQEHKIKRQAVDWALSRIEWQARNNLQITSEYNAIKAVYLNLQTKQQEWLTQHNNIKP